MLCSFTELKCGNELRIKMKSACNIIFLSFLSVSSISSAFSQNPFDFGKTDSIYFISASDIDSLNIQKIYIVDPEREGQTGGMHQNINLSVIDFSSHHESLTDHWHVETDTISLPPLDSLIENSVFINGSFWNYEDGFLSDAGMEGYGTLCTNGYTREEEFTLVENGCKQSAEISNHLIYYYSNGLPNYSVCCESINIEEEELETDTVELNQEEIYTDTTFYQYNADWKFREIWPSSDDYRNQSITIDSYNGNLTKGYQVYINKVEFGDYLDRTIGFRPRLILIEIYRFAVLSFTYSEKDKKYIYTYTIELE